MSLIGFLSVFKVQAQNVFNEVNYTPKQTTFKLNAPKKPTIRLYAVGRGGKAEKKVKMKQTSENVWQATINGDLKGKFYTFDIGKGETPGVFAKAVGCNGQRGAIIDMKTTNPIGWENDDILVLQNPADLVIYEMHHRDFSIDKSSGLMNKGKFLALTEQKAIKHLKELGINAVHILPSYDFASVNEGNTTDPQYNWGYDPLNYNVPEGSYSNDAELPSRRILEFKQMSFIIYRTG